MKVLLMVSCDPIRDNYMREAIEDCGDLKLVVIKRKNDSTISKIVYLLKSVFHILGTNIVIFTNEMNINFFRLAVLFRKQIIVDMYVSAYETNVISKKQYPIHSKEADKLLMMEQYIVSNASKLIFLNKSEKDYYLSVINSIPQKTYLLPLFNTEKPCAKLSYWSDKKSIFNICWWGAENNPIHGLENLANALDLLHQNGKDFMLYIFGSNPKKGEDYYSQFFYGRSWSNRVVIKYDYRMSNGLLVDFLVDNCSVAIGPLSEELKARTVITNKALDAINMKLPLITIESRGMKEYFSDDMVYYCKDANPQTIFGQLARIINADSNEIATHVNNAKYQLTKEFNSEQLKKKFVDIIRD